MKHNLLYKIQNEQMYICNISIIIIDTGTS